VLAQLNIDKQGRRIHYISTETEMDNVSARVAYITVSHKARAIQEFRYLAKQGKYKEGKVVASDVFPISVVIIFKTWDEPLRRYTLYIITVKSYGDVATLT
jgi:hypothetical protein